MCAANGRIMQQEGGNPTDILDNLGKGGMLILSWRYVKSCQNYQGSWPIAKLAIYGAKQNAFNC